MPSKSAGLQVCGARSFDIAVTPDHGVIASGGNCAATAVQRGSDLAKGSRRFSVEGRRVEVGFGLLKMRPSSCAVLVVGRHEWSH